MVYAEVQTCHLHKVNVVTSFNPLLIRLKSAFLYCQIEFRNVSQEEQLLRY